MKAKEYKVYLKPIKELEEIGVKEGTAEVADSGEVKVAVSRDLWEKMEKKKV